MNKSFFNPEENQNCISQSDILSAFKQNQAKPNQIQQGMSPSEIADIVSDHLMDVIKKQFDSAKQAFQADSGK